MCPETNTLHQILQAIIIDGLQRSRTANDLKARAEDAARAFRAGLAAFTTPAEPFAGDSADSTSVSIPATVNYGGTRDATVQQSAGGRFPASLDAHIDQAAQLHAKSIARLATLKRMADAAACDQDHGLAAWALLLSQAGAAPTCTPSMPKSMAEKIAALAPHLDKMVEIEMKSRERLRQMRP